MDTAARPDPQATLASLAARGRVALVHDWLTGMRGGEKVLEVLCELLPGADLYTLLHVPGSVSPAIESHPIHTSFVQRLPGAAAAYRRYLPLFPRAIESFDLRLYDYVVSTSHCVAKGAPSRADALHVCYCHTPMRYMWDQFDAYFGPGRTGIATGIAARAVRRSLQRWDVRTASRVSRFVANSEHVRERIRRIYARNATVVYPPVDCARFAPDRRGPDDYFLVAGAFAPYKRLDVAIEAARRAGIRLIVVGKGQDAARLERLGQGGRIEFLPWQSDAELARLYARCQALLFPGEEDFGIAPVECMASGRPVVAFGRGGARETVLPGKTGVLVDDQDPETWSRALRAFRAEDFDPAVLRAHAARFDRSVYTEQMASLLSDAWAEHAGGTRLQGS